MQINETYWGGADKTVTASDGTEWTSYYLLDAFNDSTLPMNEEIDVSISPWAINKNADIAKIAYPLSHRVGDTGYVHAAPKFYPIHDDAEKSIPFYICMPYYTGNYGYNFDWYCRNAFQAGIEVTTASEYRAKTQVLRGFDYNKFALYARVVYAESEYYSGISAAEFGDVGTNEVNTYFAHAPEWIATHPVIGITFQAYYDGYNDAVGFAQFPVNINTLGRQIPCGESGSPGALTGYNVPFHDNFMTLCNNGLSIGGYCDGWSGYGYIPIYDGAAWVSSYSADVDVVLSASGNTQPIAHVPTIEGETGSPWVVNSIWTGTHEVYYRTELSASAFADLDAFKDYILKQIAYLGTWFFTDITAINDAPGASEKWYLGEIDENGVTTGNYKQGAATADYSNSEWENPWESSPYSGRDDDPTSWDSSQTSNISTETGDPSYGTKEYLMSENALNQLMRVLNEFKIGEAEQDIHDGYCETAFGDTDPVKAIISVVKYPFDIINNWNGNITEQIINGSDVGAYFSIANASIPVSVAASIPSPGTQYTIDLTSAHEIYEINWTTSQWKYGTARIPYYAKYKSFLDYEPYCTASLYIPFCGSVKLDPEIFVGHSIGVDYIVSPLDGTVKAFILRDNLVIDTLTGNMGYSIEIDSSDELSKVNTIQQLNATIQAQKMNNVKRWANIGVGIGGGAVVGGGVGALIGGASSVMNATFDTLAAQKSIEQKQLEINAAETPFKQLQNGGGFLSACDEYAVRLVVYRPETLPGFDFTDWHNYGHLYGFATYDAGTLENYSGYVECSAANLDGIAATETEKRMILEALKGGVYL